MPHLLHIYSNCYADKTIWKFALNSEVFLGKLFQKKANARLFAEPRRMERNVFMLERTC